ncbi:MAG: hypothetical protein LBP59_13160 [Planctomycetaceae bacterium]|jgi:HEAT repeat protein|nr:hypothetical protein [Planctomycetaceae bacterium]
MKVKFNFFTAVILTAVFFAAININVKASEISDKFNELIAGIGASDLTVRGNAQVEWQTVCLKNSDNPAKRDEAVKLMIGYLKKDNVNGETVISFLSILGIIGDAKAVPAIKKYLNDNANRKIKFVDTALADEGNKLIIDEAVRALARIPGNESNKALNATNSIFARSGQIARSKKQKIKIETETKMPMAIPYASQKEVDRYLRNFESQDDKTKTQIIVNLGVRGDGSYSKLIKESIKSDNVELRSAAIIAIGKLESGNIVETLVETLWGDNEDAARAAATSLSNLPRKDVDVKLIEIAKTEKDAKRLEKVSEILTNRKTATFLPVLFERLKENTIPDRKKAITQAAAIATAKNISDFIDLWLTISDRGELAEVEKIIAKFANGDATAAIAKQTPENKNKMYSLLGRIGDLKTLPDFRAAFKSGSPEAFAGIREWPNATVAGDLLEVAQGKLGTYSDGDKINALRSYIRMISLPQEKLSIKITVEDQANALIEAFKIATRDDERNLVIQRLGAVRHVKSLNFAVEQIDNPQFSDSAIKTILDLAHHAALRRKDADTFKAALKLVTTKSKDKQQIERANAYLNTF